MASTFSSTRFSLLIRKEWIENRKILITGTAILFGAVALSYTFVILTSDYIRFGHTTITNGDATVQFIRFSSLNFRESVLSYSGLFYIALLSGHYFLALGRPTTAIQELTLPVSTTERTIAAFLLSGFLTLLSFTVVFLLVDALYVTGIRTIYRDVILQMSEIQTTYQYEGSVYRFEGFPYLLQAWDRSQYITPLCIGSILSSVFTLGSVYFSRLPFVKTALAVIVFVGGLLIASTVMEQALKGGRMTVGSNGSVLSDMLGFLLTAVTIITAWLATYFRLKEKEV